LTPGVYTLQWTVDNGPCANGNSADEVTITVFDNSTAPAAAGPDQEYCTPITAPVTMFASATIPPATGSWTVLGGQGTFANPNDPFSAVTDLGLGENVFQWTVDNGPCGNTNDQMSIRVFDSAVLPADAGDDQLLCQHETTTATLSATPTTSTATGAWARINGGATVTNAGDPNTTVTGLTLGDNLFVWTVSNGACGITTDTMNIRLKDCLTLIIPDAFSPNGDGTNDFYTIPNIESYPENTFTVFNRWGNKVFESTPYTNTWNGKSQFGTVFGEELPESTYYYVLDPGTGDEAFTGFIYLRR
jgi:gliding motility-associated-like protein